MKRYFVLLMMVMAAIFSAGIAGARDLREEVLELRTQLRLSADAMAQGHAEEAAEISVSAFQSFEESGFHKQLLAKDNQLYRDLESDWLKLTKHYEAGDAGAAATFRTSLERHMQEALHRFELPASTSAVVVNAFVILFREGFEALLILGAVLATLRKINRRELGRVIWSGAALGVVASLGLYVLSLHFLKLQGAGREIVEGATMLIAAVVLFYLSYWLISKVQGRRWQEFIQTKVHRALSRRNVATLGALAFLVVFREGFETVLMLRALEASTVGWTPIIQGVALAVGALAFVFVAIMVLGLKLPIRAFFAVTSVFLLFLVFKFAGDGVLELQEGGIFSFHALSWMPSWGWLKSFLGVHGSMEGLLIQSVVLAVIAVGLGVTLSRGRSSSVVTAKPVSSPNNHVLLKSSHGR